MADVTATYLFRSEGDIGISAHTDFVKRIGGEVVSLSPQGSGYVARIRYPAEIFELGNAGQYLTIVSGNHLARGARLIEMEFPDQLVKPFHGPKFGISGIRKLIGSKTRPHIGTVIRLKAGLTPEDAAEIAYRAAVGGIDLITDAGALTDQESCPIDKRVPLVMKRLAEAKDESGQEVLYAANVSAGADRILERALRAIDLGANMIMVDVAAGFMALQALGADTRIKVPIHVNGVMHKEPFLSPSVALRPLAQIARWLGADQLSCGNVSGIPSCDQTEVKAGVGAMTCACHGMKRTFPLSSGGLHPGNIAHEFTVLGTEITLLAGNGIHGHPDGTTAGARAMRQAVDAFIEGKTAKDYAKDHYELERALGMWGSS